MSVGNHRQCRVQVDRTVAYGQSLHVDHVTLTVVDDADRQQGTAAAQLGPDYAADQVLASRYLAELQRLDEERAVCPSQHVSPPKYSFASRSTTIATRVMIRRASAVNSLWKTARPNKNHRWNRLPATKMMPFRDGPLDRQHPPFRRRPYRGPPPRRICQHARRRRRACLTHPLHDGSTSATLTRSGDGYLVSVGHLFVSLVISVGGQEVLGRSPAPIRRVRRVVIGTAIVVILLFIVLIAYVNSTLLTVFVARNVYVSLAGTRRIAMVSIARDAHALQLIQQGILP